MAEDERIGTLGEECDRGSARFDRSQGVKAQTLDPGGPIDRLRAPGNSDRLYFRAQGGRVRIPDPPRVGIVAAEYADPVRELDRLHVQAIGHQHRRHAGATRALDRGSDGLHGELPGAEGRVIAGRCDEQTRHQIPVEAVAVRVDLGIVGPIRRPGVDGGIGVVTIAGVRGMAVTVAVEWIGTGGEENHGRVAGGIASQVAQARAHDRPQSSQRSEVWRGREGDLARSAGISGGAGHRTLLAKDQDRVRADARGIEVFVVANADGCAWADGGGAVRRDRGDHRGRGRVRRRRVPATAP
jgi:hypothetical protein